MSLSLTINGVDFTSKWRLYESRWTARAYVGESSTSEFVIDDDDGTIDHGDLAALKVVEVWEDASGDSVCMYRGRVSNKTLGRGTKPTGVAMRWNVKAQDYNTDMSGIRGEAEERPEESDRARVLALQAAYLNGATSTSPRARASTELGTALVVNADLVTLPVEQYDDGVYPNEIIRRITEFSAKTFFTFVDDDGDGQIYYASHTDTSYASDITITDDGSADGVDIFAPYVSASTGEHDGQRIVTGGGVRFGEDDFYEASDVAGGEAFHDKWEETFTDEYINSDTQAQAYIEGVTASRSNEDFTYICTIDMRAEDAHRIKAGMMVPLRVASANKPTSSEQRAAQVQHEPQHPDEDGNAWYKVTIDLGVPRGRPFQRNQRRRPSAKSIQPEFSGPMACHPPDETFSRTATAGLTISELNGEPWEDGGGWSTDGSHAIGEVPGTPTPSGPGDPYLVTQFAATDLDADMAFPFEILLRARFEADDDPMYIGNVGSTGGRQGAWFTMLWSSQGAGGISDPPYNGTIQGFQVGVGIPNPDAITPTHPQVDARLWAFLWDGNASSGLLTDGEDAYQSAISPWDWFWVRVRFEPTTNKLRIWPDGTGEPSTWLTTGPQSSSADHTLHWLQFSGVPTQRVYIDEYTVVEGMGEVCGTAGGDLTGSYPDPVVSRVEGVDVSSTPPALGQQLVATSPTSAEWQDPATIDVIDHDGNFVLAPNTIDFADALLTEPNPGQPRIVNRYVSLAKWGAE